MFKRIPGGSEKTVKHREHSGNGVRDYSHARKPRGPKRSKFRKQVAGMTIQDIAELVEKQNDGTNGDSRQDDGF